MTCCNTASGNSSKPPHNEGQPATEEPAHKRSRPPDREDVSRLDWVHATLLPHRVTTAPPFTQPEWQSSVLRMEGTHQWAVLSEQNHSCVGSGHGSGPIKRKMNEPINPHPGSDESGRLLRSNPAFAMHGGSTHLMPSASAFTPQQPSEEALPNTQAPETNSALKSNFQSAGSLADTPTSASEIRKTIIAPVAPALALVAETNSTLELALSQVPFHFQPAIGLQPPAQTPYALIPNGATAPNS